jgi:hypothetical protein
MSREIIQPRIAGSGEDEAHTPDVPPTAIDSGWTERNCTLCGGENTWSYLGLNPYARHHCEDCDASYIPKRVKPDHLGR